MCIFVIVASLKLTTLNDTVSFLTPPLDGAKTMNFQILHGAALN